MTTAQYRALAYDAALAGNHMEASRLYTLAADNYTPTKGAIAKRDIANLRNMAANYQRSAEWLKNRGCI
jgi:hypothetical protein